MLVLTRTADESIAIGEDIVVKVLSVDRFGSVRLGIEAPSDVEIWRTELQDAADR